MALCSQEIIAVSYLCDTIHLPKDIQHDYNNSAIENTVSLPEPTATMQFQLLPTEVGNLHALPVIT